nr:CBM_HP1_G0004200.mRNA.1.CDS.1 [Saccharomyces cerevisiae]
MEVPTFHEETKHFTTANNSLRVLSLRILDLASHKEALINEIGAKIPKYARRWQSQEYAHEEDKIQTNPSKSKAQATGSQTSVFEFFPRKNASGLGLPKRAFLRGTESEKIAASLSDDDLKEDNDKKDNDTVNAPTTVKKPPNSVLLKKFSKGKILELEIHAKIPEKRLYEGLHKLLEGWKQYGLKNLVYLFTIYAFEPWFVPNGDGRSLIKFNKKTGSTKTLTKLATEIQIILQKEGVLDK